MSAELLLAVGWGTCLASAKLLLDINRSRESKKWWQRQRFRANSRFPYQRPFGSSSIGLPGRNSPLSQRKTGYWLFLYLTLRNWWA